MLAVGTAGTVMLNGADVIAQEWATIALPGGVYPDLSLALSDLQITATDTTSLPDQVHFATGDRVMGMTFTLAGPVDPTDDTKDAAWLFGRWQTGSPLWRTDAMYALVSGGADLYPSDAAGAATRVQCFTGVVDHYEANDDGSVTVTCVDLSALLKSLPSTPVVATASPWNAGLTAEFARDAILRSASKSAPMGLVSSWPAQRPNCALAVGFRSSAWPEVGAIDTSAGALTPAFAPGVFGSGLQTGSVTYSAASALGRTVFVEFWLQGGTPPNVVQIASGSGFGADYFQVSVATTGITVTSSISTAADSFTWTTAVGTGPRYVAALFNQAIGSASWTATIWLDGTTQTTGTRTTFSARSNTYGSVIVLGNLRGPGTLEALQVTSESSPTPSYPFTPTAVLDVSLNPLDVVPPIAANADPVDTLLTMDEAEQGLGGFGPDGIYRFSNRNTLAAAPLARTVTTLTGLTEETQAGAVINRSHVGFTDWSTGKAATVWQSQGRWPIEAHATGRNAHIAWVTLTQPVVNIPATFTQLPLTGATVKGQNYFDSSLDPNGVTPDPNPPTITATQVSTQKVMLRIENADGRKKWLVAGSDLVLTYIDGVEVNAGDPALVIGGQPLTAAGEAIRDYQYPAADDGGAKSSRFGEQLWELTGNPWIQDSDAAWALARDVVWDCYVPKPALSNVAIMADPRLQLGDLVRLQDPDRTGVDEYARIHGFTLNLTDWSETLDVRAISAPGGWIGGIAGRSEGGVTTYGY